MATPKMHGTTARWQHLPGTFPPPLLLAEPTPSYLFTPQLGLAQMAVNAVFFRARFFKDLTHLKQSHNIETLNADYKIHELSNGTIFFAIRRLEVLVNFSSLVVISGFCVLQKVSHDFDSIYY